MLLPNADPSNDPFPPPPTVVETDPKFPKDCPLEKSIGSVCSCFDDPRSGAAVEVPDPIRFDPVGWVGALPALLLYKEELVPL